MAPKEPETPPKIFGRRLGALLRRWGAGWGPLVGSKLESVEFPAFEPAREREKDSSSWSSAQPHTEVVEQTALCCVTGKQWSSAAATGQCMGRRASRTCSETDGAACPVL